MAWQIANPNPKKNLVGDCVIRAISIALEQDWNTTYVGIVAKGYELKDMPSANWVWDAYLRSKNLKRYIIPDECPHCYTIKDFCNDHPNGIYILATGTHVVAVIDGDYYDTWDSGEEAPLYYFVKE